MTQYYKILGPQNESIHGGVATWPAPKGKRPGKWMPRRPVEMFRSGYHVVTLSQIAGWLPRYYGMEYGMEAKVWEVDVRGDAQYGDDKSVFAQARLTKQTFFTPARQRLYVLYRLTRCPEVQASQKMRTAVEALLRGEVYYYDDVYGAPWYAWALYELGRGNVVDALRQLPPSRTLKRFLDSEKDPIVKFPKPKKARKS